MPRLLALTIVVVVIGLPFWLTQRPEPGRTDNAEVTGLVIDDQGPVSGAVVRFKGGAELTVTDNQGYFRLPIAAGRRVTASKDGYFIAGESISAGPLKLHLTRLPKEDCERYQWIDPTPDPKQSGNCGNCHAAIHNEWKQSGHSRSSTGKPFRDQYDDLLKQHPLGADVCSSCHAPTQRPGGFGELDARLAAKDSIGRSGVHCDFCHKVQGPGKGEFGLTHGVHQLSLLRPISTDHQIFFGPLDDVDRGEDVFSPFQRDSRFCASCHEGVVFGVPVYTTYSEWQNSPAGRAGISCQQCHMTPTGKMSNIALGHGGIRRDPRTLSNHSFFDGSQLEMLRRCLKLAADLKSVEGSVELHVSLTAGDVGHRVPTGSLDRQVILFVEAFAGGQSQPLKDGPTLPAWLATTERNHPGRIYAKTVSDEKSDAPVAFWLADPSTLRDTRLQPGQTDQQTYRFPPETDRVVIRLVHRRFANELADRKSWPDNELLIETRELRLNLKKPPTFP